MNELNDLVPPLELCKLIPEGEFNDSVLVWEEAHCCEYANEDTAESNYKIESYLSERSEAIKHSNCSSAGVILYPAPKLEETLEAINVIKLRDTATITSCIGDKTPLVISTMKRWLNLKGIEVK